MAKKKQEEITLEGFNLVNREKFDRAVNGSIGKLGELTGGVGEDADDITKLAAYDKLGGLIKKDGRVVLTGCFCDIKETKKQKKLVVIKDPKVMLVFIDLEGNKVELEAGEELSPELQAAELINKKKVKKNLEEADKKEDKKKEKDAKKKKKEEDKE